MEYLFSAATKDSIDKEYLYVSVKIGIDTVTVNSYIRKYYKPSILVNYTELNEFIQNEQNLWTVTTFFRWISIDGVQICLKPLFYKLVEAENISYYQADRYSIYLEEDNYLVNYAPGKSKSFKVLLEAIEWINNVHYPAKQEELIKQTIYWIEG